MVELVLERGIKVCDLGWMDGWKGRRALGGGARLGEYVGGFGFEVELWERKTEGGDDVGFVVIIAAGFFVVMMDMRWLGGGGDKSEREL